MMYRSAWRCGPTSSDGPSALRPRCERLNTCKGSFRAFNAAFLRPKQILIQPRLLSQAAARVDVSVDHGSPQTSDDEAEVLIDVRRLNGGDAAHSSRDGHAAGTAHAVAAPQRAGHANGHQAAADPSHSASQQQHGQQRQQHGEPPHHGTPAMAVDPPPAPQAADPSQLFPSRHVPRWTPILVAYFPIGCVLGVLRMTAWVVLLAVDSALLTDNNAMIQVLYTLLGIRVRWRGVEHIPEQRHVIVSNHVTVGDLMVLYARPRPYVHLITSRLPKRITQAQNHRVKLRHASGDTYCRLAEQGLDADPIHLFPEGGMTSGRGMMRFSRGFMRFGRDLPIVPAAVRAAPAFGISTHTLTSSFGANMFWFCFAPWVELDVTVLPAMRPEEGEGNGKFVDRVQQQIAAELGIPVADMTLQQKHKLSKR